MIRKTTITGLMSKKLAAIVLFMGASAFYAYATLGELSFRRYSEGDRPLLSLSKNSSTTRNFNLKSNYQFRGSQVIRPESVNTIQLNTVMNYRVGGTTYLAPVSRKVAVNLNTHNKMTGATETVKL